MLGPAARVVQPGGRTLRRIGVFTRARLRQGLRRVRTGLVPIVQAGIAAGLAWSAAHFLLGHPMPIFAPMAAWICLGFTANRAPRAVAEMGVGSTVGVAVGETVATTFGSGPLQIAFVLIVAALFGRLLDRGQVFTFQVVGNALVLVSMASFPVPGGGLGRWTDALTGSLIAFVVTVLLPRHVEERPRRFARSALEEFAEGLEMLASAVKSGDLNALVDTQGQLVAIGEGLEDWETALKAARDVAALNPTLHSEQPRLDELDRLVTLARRAEVSLAMAVRQAIGFSEQSGRLPVVGDRIETIATAARALAGSVGGWHRPERAREVLTEVASLSAPTAIDTDDWRPGALMATLRTIVVDLLQMTGLSKLEAKELLAGTHGSPYALDEIETPAEDESSALWR